MGSDAEGGISWDQKGCESAEHHLPYLYHRENTETQRPAIQGLPRPQPYINVYLIENPGMVKKKTQPSTSFSLVLCKYRNAFYASWP